MIRSFSDSLSLGSWTKMVLPFKTVNMNYTSISVKTVKNWKTAAIYLFLPTVKTMKGIMKAVGNFRGVIKRLFPYGRYFVQRSLLRMVSTDWFGFWGDAEKG